MSLKKSHNKTTNLSNFSFVSKVSSKPGLLIGVLFFILVCVFLAISPKVNINDALLSGGYALSIHENNQGMIDYYLEGLDTQITGQYEDTITDDELFSMRNDFLWLKNKENELFNSKPSTEVLVKLMAFSYFLEDIAEINQNFLFTFSYPNQDETIEEAKMLVFTHKTSFSSEVEDIFSSEKERRTLFEKTYNDLMEEYFTTKLILISSDSTKERKYVESIKLLLIKDL